MNRRLLILCDPFTSPAYTPRVRCLCEQLNAQGWHIDLYTEQGEPLPFEHTYPIHEIRVYRTGSFAEWAVKSVLSLLFDWRNRYFRERPRVRSGRLLHVLDLPAAGSLGCCAREKPAAAC